MPIQLFEGNTDPLAALWQNRVQDRAQMAQYSILRAADFLKANRKEDAIREFKHALAMDPNNTTATTYIGNINLSLGKTEEAIAAFKDLVRQQPNSSDGHIKLGNAYISNKQYDLSEVEFRTAARLDPSNPLPDYTLGQQYLFTGRLKDAENQFLKVQRMAPGDANVYYGLGATYNALGRHDEAVRTLNTALSLKPNNPPVNYELGIAYDKLGDREAAQNQLKALSAAGSSLAQDLAFVVNKPQMLWINGSTSSFNTTLRAGSPVWYQDISLLAADTSKSLTVDIQFATAMDVGSVMNPLNWSITKAHSTEGGYYNNSAPVNISQEAAILPTPTSVTYNKITGVAKVTFTVNQNSTANATIDPSHLVFKFSGKDAFGRSMDPSADEIDGYAGTGF
ncbi:MAG: hypothetical protein A3B82_02325 [Methylophilales bacterium RIFCSPHIGHO2_02_FULL_57_10]|nr:MAG: hypothetical protein A3B82_02325 [Methylophilales bacterium RIFCSPHIGHO2_02_FULL_57_10]